MAAVASVAPFAGDLLEEPLRRGLLPGAAVPAGWIDVFGPAGGFRPLEVAHAFESATLTRH